MRCPVLIGRRDVLAGLTAALIAAVTGRGRLVALTGEPGVGKTRLAAEAQRVARDLGIAVLVGRSSPEAAASPLRPLGEALLVNTRDLPRPDSPDLAPFLPALGELLPHWRAAGWVAPAEPPTVTAEAVLRLLRHLAGPRALLLVLEDLHWADEATLGVAEFLASHSHEIPVVACLTCRDDEGSGPRLLAALERAGTDIHRLPRLAAADVDAMIAACTGEDPDRHRAVARAAGGLPLLVEDFLAAGETGLPRRFADAVRARADRLDPGQLRAVRAAALLGEEIDIQVVCQAVGSDDDGILCRSVNLGLIISDHGAPRFRHALTRTVILADLPVGERAELAAATGSALLATRPASLTRDLSAAALLAEAGEHARALETMRQSGSRAVAAGEIAEAEAALRAAFDLALPGEPVIAARLGRDLAGVLIQAGRPGEVADLGARLLSLIEGRDPALETEVHALLARAHISRGAWPQAQAHLQQARAVGYRGPRIAADIAVLETECALGEDRAGQRAAIEHVAMRGVALARTAGAADLEAEALEQVGRVARMRDLDAAAASLRSALRVTGAHGLEYRRLQVLNELGTVEMLRDARPDRLERARADSVRRGAFGLATSAGLNLASAYAMTGRTAECIALVREVGATARRLDQPPILAGCELIEGIAHAFAGHPDAAERHLSLAERLAPADADLRAGAWGIGRGVGALVMEDRDGARRALDRAAREAPERHARILDAALGPSRLLAAVAGQADRAEIGSLIVDQVRGARWHDLWLGAARAVAAGRDGDPEAAAALAVALSAGNRYPLFAALVQRLVAEAAIETRFTDPVPLLRDAEAAFDTLGTPRPAAAVRGMLRSLGAAAPRRRRGDSPVGDPLRRAGVTAREAEVLDLLADRLTNRQIAQQLYLSAKTVEKHVAALAAKLGARDRVELAEIARNGRR